MADLSNIDLDSLIEQQSPTRLDKAVGTGDKRRRSGACPWCGGNTRFAVFILAEPQYYHCWGCEKHGDAIDFVREYLALDYAEACEFLEVDPGSEYAGPRKQHEPKDEPPPVEWQQNARDFCIKCRDFLWEERNAKYLDYLRDRGLEDATIKRAGLGLKLDLQPAWDDVWATRGYVIPWAIAGELWAVNVRQFDSDIQYAKERGNFIAKYAQISGSHLGLYGYDRIKPDTPLVMVEGEFDKLLFDQHIQGAISCVATGGAGNGKRPKWIKAVSQAFPLVVAFDSDSAGVQAAQDWKELVPTSLRLTPWSHDITDMVRDGYSLHDWLEDYLPAADTVDVINQPQPLTPREQFDNAAQQLKDALEAHIAANPRQPLFTIGQLVNTPQGEGKVTWVSSPETRRVTVNFGSKFLSHNYPFSYVAPV